MEQGVPTGPNLIWPWWWGSRSRVFLLTWCAPHRTIFHWLFLFFSFCLAKNNWQLNKNQSYFPTDIYLSI
jgi:hypothetical protein